MTVKEFKEYLLECNVPDNAEIYIFADRGQDGEVAYACDTSRSKESKCYDEMGWDEYIDREDYYDEDFIDDYEREGRIRAVCLYGE